MVREPVKDRIARKLRELREASGLTQDQVARKIGISQASVARYETGASEPTVDMLDLLAQIYRVDLFDIISSPQEVETIRSYLAALRSLPEDRRQEVLQYIQERVRLYGKQRSDPEGSRL